MATSPFINLDEVSADATKFRFWVVQKLTAMEARMEPLGSITERVTTLEAQMAEMGGNGQPGRLGKLEATVAGHVALAGGVAQREARLGGVEARVGKVERFSWAMLGGLVLLGALIGWGMIRFAAAMPR